MTARRTLFAVAAVLSIVAACRSEGEVDWFCAARADAIVYANHDCGANILGLDVEAPCTAECVNPGYAECPGPCIEWRIHAPQPTTCQFTVHFKKGPDLSENAEFVAVIPTDMCPARMAGGDYYLPEAPPSFADAAVESGAPPNDAAPEADAADASSDADAE